MDDETISGVLAPVPQTEEKRREERVRDRFWFALRRVAANAPFAVDLVAAYYCVMDDRTPVRARGMLLAALAYFILPTDMIPDFILALGFTDDIAVLTAAIAAVSAHVTEAHRDEARKTVDAFVDGADRPRT